MTIICPNVLPRNSTVTLLATKYKLQINGATDFYKLIRAKKAAEMREKKKTLIFYIYSIPKKLMPLA